MEKAPTAVRGGYRGWGVFVAGCVGGLLFIPLTSFAATQYTEGAYGSGPYGAGNPSGGSGPLLNPSGDGSSSSGSGTSSAEGTQTTATSSASVSGSATTTATTPQTGTSTTPTTGTSTPITGTTTVPHYRFERDLAIGATGTDVYQLQTLLNALGFTLAHVGPGAPGSETQLYGMLTAGAVTQFQEAHAAAILTPVGLTSGTGYFGPSTRAFVHTMAVTAPAPADSCTGGTVGSALGALIPNLSSTLSTLSPETSARLQALIREHCGQ